jgi:AraC family transcriptional regulator of adaptative response/methylated-DNA-[protein]-cysteine methyltransferase
MNIPALIEPETDPANDYLLVRGAIEFVSGQWRDQPSLEDIAGHVGLSPARLTALFRRWAGLTPKDFLQALTLDHARTLLRNCASVLDAAYEVGLSGPGRLHDLFVAHEAMSPGEYKSGGSGLEFGYGFHPSPFGEALAVMAPERPVTGLASGHAGSRPEAGCERREGRLHCGMQRWRTTS